MKVLNISIVLIIFSVKGIGQFYPLEAGVTGGMSSGVNFRVFLSEELSYESQLSFRNEGAQINLFRQIHNELDMTESGSVYFVFGFGVHAGFYYTDVYHNFFRTIEFDHTVFSPVAGVDGYAAFEYRLHDAPVSFGISYQPFMEFSLREIFGLNFWNVGFTFKYRFQDQHGYY